MTKRKQKLDTGAGSEGVPAEVLQQAREVLAANDRGCFTVPTAPLYPHQWLWDSAWIALGWAESDERRAWAELESLFSAQWADGMLPHIVFHSDEKTYFPGPDVWRTGTDPASSGITQPPVVATVVRRLFEGAEDRELARRMVRALWPKLLAYHRWLYRARDPEGTGLVAILHPWESGMDNSPQWDDALARVPIRGVGPAAGAAEDGAAAGAKTPARSETTAGAKTPARSETTAGAETAADAKTAADAGTVASAKTAADAETAADAGTVASAKTAADAETTADTGTAAGTEPTAPNGHVIDLSARKDLQHVDEAERPTDDDYRRYMSLVAQFRAAGYDPERLHDESPFCVVDVGFNALLHRANLDLCALARAMNFDASEPESWVRRGQAAFEQLWSEELGTYVSWDRRSGRPISVAAAAGLLPLFAALPTPDRAARLAKTLEEWGRSVGRLVPSTAPSDPRFEPRRYWRGPVWVVVNWLVWQGLRRYGFDALARRVEKDTFALVAREGFREYYDPRDGTGLGGRDFSWSAALLLHWTGRGRNAF